MAVARSGLIFLTLTVAALAGLTAVTARAASLAVNPAGTGKHPTIQAAIDAAGPGDIVQLAPGTYSGPGNVDLVFAGKAITLRGRPEQPEICVIDCAGGVWRPPHRAIHFSGGEGQATRIEGIMVVNGQALGDRPPVGSGGAILCQGASPTLVDCVFRGNRAYSGGAIALEESAARLVRCRFEENTASHGGAVMIFAGKPVLDDCAFIANTGTSGGAVSCLATTLHMTGCHFDANSATSGGAVAAGQDTDLWISGCLLSNNFATFGGAIHGQAAHLRIEGCTLVLNGAGSGGGLLLEQSAQAEISHSIIAFGSQGKAIAYLEASTVSCVCTLIYGNMDGDWTGDLAYLVGKQGNLWQPPRLNEAEVGDFRPAPNSPCLPEPQGCGLRGALGPAPPQ